MHVVVAAAVHADGQREFLGLKVASAEDGAGWLDPEIRGEEDTRSLHAPMGRAASTHRGMRHARHDPRTCRVAW
uniref:transposase n=1 Tax=Nonomuraea fuscirosea TaxID=1291556 RepID=UPI003899AA13